MATRCPGLHPKVQILDQPALRGIGEIYVLQIHTAVHMLKRYRIRSVRRLRFLFDQFKDPCRAGKGILQLGNDAGNFIEGLCVLIGVA